MKRNIFLTLISLCIFSEQVYSAETSGPRDMEVHRIAKKRLYAGGKDESNLDVQAQLTIPVRKINPNAEEPQEPDSHDND